MTVKNIAHSVHARLANYARASNRPFNEVLQYYAMERFLYRLSVSESATKFVLKGALMMRVWNAPASRPTRDIDMLGYISNEVADVVAAIRGMCGAGVEADGIHFDTQTIKGTRIKEDADYEGVRVTFLGFLGTAQIPMQLDIGFGDVVTPAPTMITYPSILDFPPPQLRGYPRETVIAEKFQAMVELGTLNSRMKDFYDIWLMSRQFDFDASTLSRALVATFKNRSTELPSSTPVALTPEFTDSDAATKLWGAFIRRQKTTDAPTSLADVAVSIDAFLMDLVRAAARGEEYKANWRHPGPWRPASGQPV